MTDVDFKHFYMYEIDSNVNVNKFTQSHVKCRLSLLGCRTRLTRGPRGPWGAHLRKRSKVKSHSGAIYRAILSTKY